MPTFSLLFFNLCLPQNLQVLDFRGGGLKGALPVELTSLAKLKVLSLDDNTLTGKIVIRRSIVPYKDVSSKPHDVS